MLFHNKTLRFRFTVISIGFSLFLAAVISVFSFSWYRAYARRNAVQAAEFNLQLIQGITEQQMESVLQLIRWCNANLQISEYFSGPEHDAKLALQAYERLNEEVLTCSASYYIGRIILTDLHGKMLQTGNRLQQSEPISKMSLQLLEPLRFQKATAFADIMQDPLTRHEIHFIIPIAQPLYHVYTKKQLGWIYIGLSAQLFTDQLKSYYREPDTSFFITLQGKTYRLGNNTIEQEAPAMSHSGQIISSVHNTRTDAGTIIDKTGRHIYVSYPFTAFDAWYTQILSRTQDTQHLIFFIVLIAVVIVFLTLFALLLRRLLTILISVPVLRLQKKLQTISCGDFTADPTIEWDDELGSIGKGINSLALSVDSLMKLQLVSEKQKRDLEYKMLQNQINPHFLYNTLNSIRWMATIQNAPGIAETVTSLASLLKNISNNTEELLSLKDELSLLDDYFVIQKYRYGGSITMDTHIEDRALLDAMIPRFTLQPLIENAIFHGIEPKGTAGAITVTVSACTLPDRAQDVQIAIHDNGIGMSSKSIEAALTDMPQSSGSLFKHVGLSNVDKRIKYTFGQQYGLAVTSKEGSWTCVTVLLPPKGTQPL